MCINRDALIQMEAVKMERKVLRDIHERIIKSFMDIIILAELRNGPISGYDVISLIHNKFNLLVSSGTVYSLLYSLERNGLIQGTWDERKRVYKLTDKGAKTIETILNANDKIKNFVTSLLKISPNP
ncbi:MAG: PadR family transcriptional regulator [Candidatus Bathyarchaeota archaeon]|nr:PadR family transcriptional regulator [Candidatus Bathyarchaeota archaeon]